MSEPVVGTSNPLPVLRREAILPRERRGGLGAVALLCSLAGVASGFALATTILATQIAESEARMARHGAFERHEWGTFLGVQYNQDEQILDVLPGTPAATVGLQKGDVVLRYDAVPITEYGQLGDLIHQSSVGHEASIDIRRGERVINVRPVLIWHEIRR